MTARVRRYAAILLPAAAAGATFVWLGTPDDAISVTGTVIAGAERDIVSPVEGRVRQVHARAGDELTEGQPIVSLDVGAAEDEARLIEQDLAIKTSEQLRAQMALQDALNDIDLQIDRKALELQKLNGVLARARRQLADGQGTDEEVEAALLPVQQAEFELARFQEQRWRLKAYEAAEVDTLSADRRALILAALENRQALQQRIIRTNQPVLLVALDVRAGDQVHAGQRLARVAGRDDYRVRMTLPPGMPPPAEWVRVRVRLDEEDVEAAIAPDSPAGPEVVLTPADSGRPGLRPGMRVTVLITP